MNKIINIKEIDKIGGEFIDTMYAFKAKHSITDLELYLLVDILKHEILFSTVYYKKQGEYK